MTSTLDPKTAEKQCNQNINLNDDEDDQFLNSAINTNQDQSSNNAAITAPSINQSSNHNNIKNAISQKQNSNDDDDDFFSELGGNKNSRPNPSKLVLNQPGAGATAQFLPNGQQNCQPTQNMASNTPTNLDNLSKEIQSLAIQKGDDEPSDITIAVTDPRKIGDSFLDSYIVFKVRTVITPNTKTSEIFRNTKETIVDRRFSDFLGLYEKLKAKYQHKGILVPPPPEKDVKSLAKVRLAQTEVEATELNATARRRSALERYLNRTAAHSELIKDDMFFDFLTNPAIQSSKQTTSAFSLSGMKKIFKSAEDQVAKLAKPYVEHDAWFDEKQNSVERTHQQYLDLYTITTKMYRSRREMGESFISLSQELGGLVNLEKGYDKSGYLTDLTSKLGQTYNDIQRAVQVQQKVDCFDLAEIVGDHVRTLEAVKELLFVRTRAFQAVQAAEENLYGKEQAKNRAEGEAKFDRIPKLDYEINEWKKNVDKSKEQFIELSNTIKKEISIYEVKRTIRMKQSVKAYLEQLANHHLKMADIWKEYLNNSNKLL